MGIQVHDSQVVGEVLDTPRAPLAITADKAYDSEKVRQQIKDEGALPVIPSRRTATKKAYCLGATVKRGLYLVHIAMNGCTRSALNLQIFCRCFSLIRDFLVFDNLPLIETAEAGFLDSGDMDKHIFSACLRLNKAVPLLGIEPLHSARSHFHSPL
jgi:hypothetical protein